MSKEAMFYDRLPNNKVRCNLCGRKCIISEGGLGVCAARKNEKGTLLSLSYSRACSVSVDPIEKKPLFHYQPGSQVLSIASPYCNFFCCFCQNWIISQSRTTTDTHEMTPEAVVKTANRLHCDGISYTYTEPTTFFEWAYDTAKLAHKNALFNTFVTNGYLTTEAVKEISPYLDAATVDFKGSGDPKFYREFMRVPSVDPVYNCLKSMKKYGVHIEITNLIVPKHGDSKNFIRKLTRWIKINLGEDTPTHFLRFYPNFELIGLQATPIETIENARKIALETGLKYVYSGNISGDKAENTYCPKCNRLLIARYGFSIGKWNITKDVTCPECNTKIPIVGKYHSTT